MSRVASRGTAPARHTGVGTRVLALLVVLSLLEISPVGAAPEALAAKDAPAFRAGVFDPPRKAPDFQLEGSDGAPLHLGRLRGKVVILEFGFTSCTEVCPFTLATLARARKLLGDAAEDVQVVFVTVDPERDDPERLRNYLASFDASFLGATGTPEALEEMRSRYGIAAEKVIHESGYSYSHSSYTYLIDRQGNLRALVPYGRPAEDYTHDIGILTAP